MLPSAVPLAARCTRLLPTPAGGLALAVRGYGLREEMSAGMIDRPRGTPDWLVMAFPGPVLVRVGAADVAVPGNSLVLWRPGSRHRYGLPGQRWRHSWLHVDGRLLASEVAAAGIPLDVPQPGIPVRWLDRCLHALHEEIAGNARPDPIILRNAVQTLLRQLARVHAGGAAIPPGLLAARTFVESEYAQRLTLRDLARHAGCSPSHVSAGFQRWFGSAPIDYLIRVRLQHAWRLLQDGAPSIAAVAEAVGYDDPRHFSKLFRARFGCTPRSVRGGDAAQRGRLR